MDRLRKDLVAVVCAAALFSCTVSPSTTAEKDAVVAATAWLQLVDGAQYSQSWKQSAALFRKAVASGAWTAQISAVRQPLGPVASRKLASINHTTSLPGAPDGDYVVLQYQTSFANKNGAVETVTPMRDPDNRWRVSGYYIK